MNATIWMAVLGLGITAAGTGCGRTDSTAARAPEAAAPGVSSGAREGGSPPAVNPGAADEGAATGHAAGIVPGSYEDWCAEHEVPETQCTRCDPSLTPAFKAVGDWDEKHGLPKSQCLKCDPTLRIVRPPKPEVSG